MRYVYCLTDASESEQREGIKEYFASRGIYPGDCTTLQADYKYEENEYDLGIRNLISNLKPTDILYVWDFAVLGKSLEKLYATLLLGVNNGISIIQCMDGTVASNDTPESIAIVNAIGIASRIELKVSNIQKRQTYWKQKQVNKSINRQTSTIELGQTSSDKIIIRRYTAKSVLICGDSRQYKDAIREIGALFNPRIDNGKAAWLISLRKLKQLQEVLAGANYEILPDCYISRQDYKS